MSDLNCCAFTGRLTKNAELKLIGAKQTPCVEFSLANNTGFGNYAKTSYFDVQLWGSSGQNLLQYLLKGQPVAVSGELTQNSWVDQNGGKHTSWRLSASKLTLLNSRQSSNYSDNAPAEADYGDMVY